jgi:serine/threonine protein kinase
MEERNALVFSQKSEWITTIYAAFQDDENLYLVMEYVSGGSLRALLNSRESIMQETEAKFYIAEMIISLQVLHEHNYIHRDVKPENYLIDSQGHIKLADFGSCIRVSETAKISSNETVGTPDYISPEILRALEGNSSYGLTVDWWSVGIILYELLYDEVPFYSESLVETYGKIMDHKNSFSFPIDIEVSETCKNLISKLICNQDTRLGKNGFKELTSHPWFDIIDWENIRDAKAPFIPELSGPEDTRYFEDEENESKKFNKKKPPSNSKDFSGQNLPFVGYTYVKDATAKFSFSDQKCSVNIADINPESNKQLETLKLTNFNLEKDSQLLKAAISKENELKNEMSSKLANLQSEQRKIESDFSSLKMVHQNELEEKKELQEILNGLKSSLDNSNQSRVDTKELEQIKKMMEAEIKQLTIDLISEKEQDMRREQNLVESRIEIETLSEKLKGLNLLTMSHTEEKLSYEMQILLLQTEIQDFNKSLALSNEKLNGTTVTYNLLRCEADLSADLVHTKVLENETLILQINDFQKSAAILNVDITILNKRLEELTCEKANNLKLFAEAKNNIEKTDHSKIQDLHTQLSTSEDSRDNLAREISCLNKKILLLDIDIDSEKKNLSNEQEAHSKTNNSIKSFKQYLEKGEKEKHLINELKMKAESKIVVLETELSTEKVRQAQMKVSIEKLELQVGHFVSQITTLTMELKDLNVRYKLEEQQAESLKSRLQTLQEQYSIELKSRVSYESSNHDLELTNNNLTQEIDRLRVRMFAAIKEREQSASTAQKYLSQYLAEESKTLHMQLELEYSQIEISRLLQEREEIAVLSQKAFNGYENLEQRQKVFEEQNISLRKKLELERENFKQLEYRNAQLESVLDNNKLTGAESNDELSSPKKKGWNRFFNQVMEDEGTDNTSNDSGNAPKTLSISIPHKDTQSSKHSIPKGRTIDIEPLLFMTSDELSGWLKLPKGGKVKKGWIVCFGIVKEYQLNILETKPDAKTPNPIELNTIDIRSDIFLASPVSQNELIHASSKDIDLIFKIQVSNSMIDPLNIDSVICI